MSSTALSLLTGGVLVRLPAGNRLLTAELALYGEVKGRA